MLDRFKNAFALLSAYLAHSGLPPVTFNQCEVNYINHVSNPIRLNAWREPFKYFNVFNPFPVADGEVIEDNSFQIRYLLTDGKSPVARLYVIGQPMIAYDQQPIFGLTLSVKGPPHTAELTGVTDFFKLGHDTIVRKFDTLATEFGAAEWGRST